ncbi:lactonase family protein [Sediminibacillus massiliensis]|uniref:lactonase family protein n=1 Tax=Sediminibacillus massiliensis TaxID=1926277 RepID=UPI000988907B|nr:lactonase family protein [Sediminibacillus massiliensis]
MEKVIYGFIGTYTKGDSEGVYLFRLNTEDSTVSVETGAKVDNPTYVTVSNNNRYLYAVAKEGDKGGAAAFAIDPETKALTRINSQVTEGANPCHISVDKSNQLLLSANYHKGTVDAYRVDEGNGTIEPPFSIAKHEGSGPHERQEKPHTHYSGFTPDEKYVVAVDLGNDNIYTYEVAGNELKEVSRLATKEGSGPRHIAFHPNGKYAYVMTELSNEVILLDYNQEDGSFKERQYISTIPEDFNENSQGSAIHLSSDGRFVYAGNRGHDSIALFEIDQSTGELSFKEWTSTEGDWPRDFSLDPTEQYLLASNQNSSNLTLFARDEETGKLQLLQKDVSVPDPVCVKFLHQ